MRSEANSFRGLPALSATLRFASWRPTSSRVEPTVLAVGMLASAAWLVFDRLHARRASLRATGDAQCSLLSEGSALSPVTDEQQNWLRGIVREECRAAYPVQEPPALQFHRTEEIGMMPDHAEGTRIVDSNGPEIVGVDVQHDGVSVELVAMPGGARRGVWRRHSALMTHAEIDAYLRGNRKPPPARFIRRLATAFRALANRESASDAR